MKNLAKNIPPIIQFALAFISMNIVGVLGLAIFKMETTETAFAQALIIATKQCIKLYGIIIVLSTMIIIGVLLFIIVKKWWKNGSPY